MTSNEIESTYEIVKMILKAKPDTRSSDTLLLAYVQKYCKDNDFTPLSTESLSRARRRIQNTEGLFPASKEAQEKRRKKQEEYRATFSDERLKRIEERIKEIINIAIKLKWVLPKRGNDSYPTMQISEVEKCMLAMVNDIDLERMRKWFEETR